MGGDATADHTVETRARAWTRSSPSQNASAEKLLGARRRRHSSEHVAPTSSGSPICAQMAAIRLGNSQDEAEKKIKKTGKLRIEKILSKNFVAIHSVCAIPESTTFGIALATWLSSSSLASLVLAFTCIKNELELCSDITLLFRGQTVNTRVLGTMVNVCGRRFIHDLLKPFVTRVVDERLSFEIDPTREPELSKRSENQASLSSMANELMVALRESVTSLPQLISILTRELYKETKARFPRKQDFAVSALLILRFVVPALTMPDKWDIVTECSRDLRRNLLILSKLLQNVYNQTTHVKESWMEPMMPFVQQHITEVTLLSMRVFENEPVCYKQLEKELRHIDVSKADRERAGMELHLGVSYGISDLHTLLLTLKSQSVRVRRVKDAVSKAYAILDKEANFSFEEQFEEILAWCAAHRGGLQALPSLEDGHFEMPMLSALEGEASEHEEDFNVCLLRLKKDNGQVLELELARPDFSAKSVQRSIKSKFSDIEKVFYVKDGHKYLLSFSSFQHFEGSGVVKRKRAIYRLLVLSKANAKLESYLAQV